MNKNCNNFYYEILVNSNDSNIVECIVTYLLIPIYSVFSEKYFCFRQVEIFLIKIKIFFLILSNYL